MGMFSKYIPQFVYGAFDGIVTTFAVVTAAAASEVSSVVVLIFGLANLFADGFSIGASAFLSSQAERKKNRKAAHPIHTSVITFLAFLMLGFIPISPYFVDVIWHVNFDKQTMLVISAVLTVVAFLWVGYAKSVHQKRSVISSTAETFILGVIAASLAYGVGAVLKEVFGV